LGVQGEKSGRRFADFLKLEDKVKKLGEKGLSQKQGSPDYVVHLSQKPE